MPSMIQQNEATAADRRVPFRMIDANGDGVTGLTVTVGVRKNFGASAAGAGTVTELSLGNYYYQATAGEVDTLGSLLLTFSGTGAKTISIEVPILTYDPWAAPDSAASIATAVWAAGTRTLTSFGTLAADVWAAATRSLTDKADFALSVASREAVADSLLGRAIAGGSNAGRTVRQALRRLRNRVALAGGTATVYAEDDTTADWTATVTTGARDPVNDVNPA